MDKHKLVRIIAKDLEELKTLNDEIEANEDASSLIIDLALSRARLLCQELELLQSFSAPAVSLKEEAEMENTADDEDEESELSFPEPELEILHFEEADYSNSDELEEEIVVYDSDDEEPDEETEEDFEEDEEPVEEELTENDDSEEEPVEEEEVVAEGFEDDDSTGIEEHELDTDEDEAVSEIEEEEEEPVKQVQQSFRQIEIEELDEEDDDVEFSPVPNPETRPVMHEIPKPEDISSETRLEEEVEEDDDEQEVTAAETFQKERSLNETLGENKAETNLSNSPIASLRAAIGLNDRFLFIKEIFSNNSEKYNTIIDQLDKMETIQQAVDYLKVNLSLQKNETSMKFVDLLKRRFTK